MISSSNNYYLFRVGTRLHWFVDDSVVFMALLSGCFQRPRTVRNMSFHQRYGNQIATRWAIGNLREYHPLFHSRYRAMMSSPLLDLK